jgi:hypothetical protein
LLAEWHLDSPHVNAILDGHPIENRIDQRIGVPASIYHWKASNQLRDQAIAVQLENRHKFQQAFSQGLAVLGFTRDAEGNGTFELGPLSPPEQGSE